MNNILEQKLVVDTTDFMTKLKEASNALTAFIEIADKRIKLNISYSDIVKLVLLKIFCKDMYNKKIQ